MSLPDDDGPGLLANVSSGDNSPPLSVSEISGALKRTVEQNFSNVRVRGEISGWKRHSSGHCYFTLKDDKSNLDGVLWRGQASRLKFEPEDGVEVIASGRLSTYGARSKYQMVVSSLELAGEGALMALLDKRRRTLAAEGLFDESRKRALPFLPKTIGVVSSPTGAVIRDILHRLADRCPSHVILWPVPVQGEGAATKIAAAIRGFADHQPQPDLLIVARGGGSIEDLWAFNEEEVVRAAADSSIPLISAVGHETDTTLIDFVSDRRAPTPTAAAEMAVPVLAELSAFIDSQGERASQALSRRIDLASERIGQLRDRWPQSEALFEPIERRLAEPVARLPRALAGRASEARADFATIAGRLRPALVSERIANATERLGSLWRLAGLAHPERPLQRGFVRVTDREGNTLVHAADARSAGRLSLRFADGSLGATVDGSAAALERAAPKSYRPRRKTGPKAEGQPGLFDDEE